MTETRNNKDNIILISNLSQKRSRLDRELLIIKKLITI